MLIIPSNGSLVLDIEGWIPTSMGSPVDMYVVEIWAAGSDLVTSRSRSFGDIVVLSLHLILHKLQSLMCPLYAKSRKQRNYGQVVRFLFPGVVIDSLSLSHTLIPQVACYRTT